MKHLSLAEATLSRKPKEAPKKDEKKDEKNKKEVTGMHIRKAKGGFVVRHESNDMMGQPEEHVMQSPDDLHAHIQQHLIEGGGDNEAAEGEAVNG